MRTTRAVLFLDGHRDGGRREGGHLRPSLWQDGRQRRVLDRDAGSNCEGRSGLRGSEAGRSPSLDRRSRLRWTSWTTRTGIRCTSCSGMQHPLRQPQPIYPSVAASCPHILRSKATRVVAAEVTVGGARIGQSPEVAHERPMLSLDCHPPSTSATDQRRSLGRRPRRLSA